MLIAIVHYLNQLRQCDLKPADCQTRFCKCYFRRSRDFKVSKGRQPLNTKYFSILHPPPRLNLLLKNGSRLKCLKISLLSLQDDCYPTDPATLSVSAISTTDSATLSVLTTSTTDPATYQFYQPIPPQYLTLRPIQHPWYSNDPTFLNE